MTSFHDIMRISCAIGEETIKGEHYQTSGPSCGYSGTRHSGMLTSHRPSTLTVLVPLMEKNISRIECVICLSIWY